MDNLFNKKNECCGCGACLNVCPKGAIHMQKDECGFLYPVTDAEKCIDCGLCKSVCAFQNGYKINGNLENLLVYAAKNKSENTVATSSSGGVFSALAEYVISLNGSVYGAAFDDNFNLQHSRACSIEQLQKIKGSKYIQSNVGQIYKSVKKDLENNLDVLFCSTGCQVQGLREYLKKDYKNLILVDIVCHGVPSPMAFSDYIHYMENKRNDKITKINFRAKKIYGETQDVLINFKSGKEYSEYPDVDIFKKLFGKNLLLRPSCFECRYANTHRCGDITLGDFWGIEKSVPKFDNSKGTSLVIVNSSKGKAVFDKIQKNLSIVQSSIENAMQPNLKSPTAKPQAYENFWNDYFQTGFCDTAKKYVPVSRFYRDKRRIKTLIKKLLKK